MSGSMNKAIPWDVNDVVNFTRQKESKNFKDYLSHKGGASTQATKEVSQQDQQALDWANANPNDLRSALIKKKLGL